MRLTSWLDLGLAGVLWLLGLQLYRSAAQRHRRRKRSGEPGARGDLGAQVVTAVAAVMVATGLALVALSLVLGTLAG